MEYAAFLKNVGIRSALGEDHDSVIAAVKREEVANRGKYYQERIQAVTDEACRRAAGGKDSQERELDPNPDTAFLSKAFAKRLAPWAQELREKVFRNPDVPFPGDLAAAADWIETQSAADRERWRQESASCIDAVEEIKRLADLASLVVKPVPRLLKYARPDEGHQKTVGVYPGTSLDQLAREIDRVSEKTAFQPEVLTGFVLTGLQPQISRVRIRKHRGKCQIPGDYLPNCSVTLTFNAADVSYKEVRGLYTEIREFFGVTDAKRLSRHEFDFISLVDSMGGPPEHGLTRFWQEVQRRWNEEFASQDTMLSSWRVARNKFKNLDKRKNLRELGTPNPPPTLVEQRRRFAAIDEILKQRNQSR